MSAASAGSVWVSSAITSRPAWRALSSEGTIALESLGVIIRPFAPAEIRFSTAATWDSLSPSFLPAKDCTEAPSVFAELLAPSFIFTKNGFVSVLVIRPTLTASPRVLPPLADEPPPLSLPQAATPAARAHADATANRPRPSLNDLMVLPLLRPGHSGLRQRFQEGFVNGGETLVKQLRKRILARRRATGGLWCRFVETFTGRRPTMKEVARVAGVSLATVSRVLSGTGEVRADLAERVQEAVRMLGYRRDLTASTLRRADRSSASIGLIIEDVSNPVFSSVHRGVEDVARPRGVLTFVGSSDERPERERELAETFGARGVDGLVIVPCATDQSYLMRDHRAGTALVFVDRPPRYIPGHAVVSDNAGGARAGVEHLIAAGHRRIAFLGDRLSVFTALERRAVYREALGARA